MTENIKLDPLPVTEWDSGLKHIIEDMDGRPINVHALMAHHPELLEAWWNFRNYSVAGGALGKRYGELLILRVALHMKAWYEWGSHVERSLACGLTLEEIERVKKGGNDPAWSSSEASLLKAIDELIATRKLSPGSLLELQEHFSTQQIMDMIAIHGMYIILGCMINTWGPELETQVLEKLPEGVTQTQFEQEFPHEPSPDLAMPTMLDAEKCHSGYARWKHVLPLPNRRMMLHIGAQTAENFYVVADAWAQVLSRYIPPGSHVMDVGCGCGRTARLLTNNHNVKKYTGFDVVEPYVAWCNKFFGEIYGDRFQFFHLDVQTDRYNPGGSLSCKTARFPADSGQVDFLFAASLFTHQVPGDLSDYAKEIQRVLKPGGLALVSIHDQPKEGKQFSGDEHRADYAPEYFESLMKKTGFEIEEDIGDLCGQRTFLLRKISAGQLA